MHGYLVQISILLMLTFQPPAWFVKWDNSPSGQQPAAQTTAPVKQGAGPAKQLFAVRGEVTRIESKDKGMVAITVRPPHDNAAVTVIARENDIVGIAVGHHKSADLVGLLAGEDQRENERITAAEVREGDIVSVIYDPMAQNRALEIYMH